MRRFTLALGSAALALVVAWPLSAQENRRDDRSDQRGNLQQLDEARVIALMDREIHLPGFAICLVRSHVIFLHDVVVAAVLTTKTVRAQAVFRLNPAFTPARLG